MKNHRKSLTGLSWVILAPVTFISLNAFADVSEYTYQSLWASANESNVTFDGKLFIDSANPTVAMTGSYFDGDAPIDLTGLYVESSSQGPAILETPGIQLPFHPANNDFYMYPADNILPPGQFAQIYPQNWAEAYQGIEYADGGGVWQLVNTVPEPGTIGLLLLSGSVIALKKSRMLS